MKACFKHCTEIKCSMKDFFSKYDEIRTKLPVLSHLQKKSLIENILCAVKAMNSHL